VKSGLRISGGSWCNRRLLSTRSMSFRPTGERVRQSLFNVITQHQINSGVFLDAFAGSGVVGMEAISRGAPKSVFIEKNKDALTLLKKNLKNLEMEPFAVTCQGDAVALIRNIMDQYDVRTIYLDPPYESDLSSFIFPQLTSTNTSIDTLIILEQSRTANPMAVSDEFMLVKRKEYGDTVLSFFSRNMT
jgi:16S rRNA (guanine966-N2)-methyltransferase